MGSVEEVGAEGKKIFGTLEEQGAILNEKDKWCEQEGNIVAKK